MKALFLVFAQLSHTHFWIDGTDREVQGNWFWEWTGEQIAPMYTNWHTAGNEPNNLGGNEHCLEYGPVYGYQWNDIPCSHHFSAICEKD
ncbi:hypothetical protein KUTeg_006571 [Tegillarca granosa]|uniref:C-type lectin domain-containing protein n=1 Tax=Tegillarca granosa TaxID=220873 RepID=A0ABQ9FAS9_TEGGR|nr:hypothetical protein KUTeg_006571 [Tegillarca granosa]